MDGIEFTVTHTEGRSIRASAGCALVEVTFEPYACASGKWAAARRARDLREVLDDGPLRTNYTILQRDWERHGTASFKVEILLEAPDCDELDAALDALAESESVADAAPIEATRRNP